MPSIPIIMPQLGESIAEANIINFLVQPGDVVGADQEVEAQPFGGLRKVADGSGAGTDIGDGDVHAELHGLHSLFCGGRLGRLQVGRISEMDRRVRFERALEVEALGDLADRRENFRAHQLDAGERVLLADAAIVAPQRQDAGPRLLEDALELGDHRLGRAGDDAQVGHLLLEAGLAARILRPSGGELDEGAARGR